MIHSPTLLNGFLQKQNRHHRREVPVDKSEWHKNMTAYIRADVILVQLHYCRLHTFSHSKIYFSLLLKFSTSISSTLQFLSVLAVYFQLQNGKYTSSILQFYKQLVWLYKLLYWYMIHVSCACALLSVIHNVPLYVCVYCLDASHRSQKKSGVTKLANKLPKSTSRSKI